MCSRARIAEIHPLHILVLLFRNCSTIYGAQCYQIILYDRRSRTFSGFGNQNTVLIPVESTPSSCNNGMSAVAKDTHQVPRKQSVDSRLELGLHRPWPSDPPRARQPAPVQFEYYSSTYVFAVSFNPRTGISNSTILLCRATPAAGRSLQYIALGIRWHAQASSHTIYYYEVTGTNVLEMSTQRCQ